MGENQRPHLGLVCLSFTEECRFRTTTLSRFRTLPPDEQRRTLESIYWDNVNRLNRTLSFCDRRDIRLYRISSSLFPMSDEPVGEQTLRSLAAGLSAVGRRAQRLGIRLVIHPDQFCVLNSESARVVDTSIKILDKHALAFDLIGLPHTPWAPMILHGGKAGRAAELVETIQKRLPPNVRGRLCLENDEYAFGTTEILDVCRRTGVPMVFDCHHHVIKEGLDSYDHPSVAEFTERAASTWPDRSWQLCHVSNGDAAFLDRYHSQHVTMLPRAFDRVPWLEVEARGKELAIAAMREQWPDRAEAPDGLPLRKP
ncbi:MAG TPA: hypothetical protein VK324_11525, partial [Tepidisphaeraceae bacterium]|nr:hypothetical protein [Tepidisphaeraceae bacterium]